MIFKSKKTGQLSLPIALVGSILASSVLALSSYFGTVNSVDNKIADVRQEVAVHATKIENLDSNLSAQDQRMTRIEAKIDALLTNQRLDPKKYQ